MNIDTGNAVTPDEVIQLRLRIRELNQNGDSWSFLAKDSGIGGSTLHAFVDGKYKGNMSNIALKVREYLDSRSNRESIKKKVTTEEIFLKTEASDAIIARLQYALALTDFSMITGVAGTGKTAAITQFSETTPNVFLVTMAPSCKSLPAALDRVARGIGLRGVSYKASMASQKIAERLAGMRSMLIVDECNHVGSDVIEELRSIYDLANCAMVLVGNDTLFARYAIGNDNSMHPQVTSRIGLKLNMPLPKKEDVFMLCREWDVHDLKEQDFMFTVSQKPGALRGVVKTLKLAKVIASGDEGSVKLKHLKAAFSQFSIKGGA